jgi:hypothetical protein
MITVPLQPLQNMTLQVQLDNQACTINIQQYPFGLFLTLYVGGSLIIASVLCENLVRIVRDTYLGFSGDLVFFDTQGSSDPVYTGLGTRFKLIYLSPSDLSVLGVSG